MTFTREDIIEMSENYLDRRIVDHGRWTVTYEYIAEREGKFYRFMIDQPATESQDYDRARYDVTVVEVKKELVPTMVWTPVEKDLG